MPGILIPFYAYPKLWESENEWVRLASLARRYPAVPITAIVNPCNGPGRVVDPYYLQGIAILRDAGVRLAGYVSTAHASRSPDDVRADIDAYNWLYSFADIRGSGVFFDEMLCSLESMGYYNALAGRARVAGLYRVIGNPGALPSPPCVGDLDLLNVYENEGYPPLDSLSPLRTNRAYGRKEVYSLLAWGCANLSSDWITQASVCVGHLYLTDRTGVIWDALPRYFEEMLRLVDAVR